MTDRDEIAAILAEWHVRTEQGEELDPEQFISSHPEHADQLRAHFAVLDVVDRSLAAEVDTVPRRIGDYTILREIGRGGMGVVYEAEQTKMRRKVALKVLSLQITGTAQAIKRFQREAQAAGRLHHTNIVPVHDLDQHAGYWYYAMELVRGRALSKLITELRGLEGPPTEESLAGAPASAITGTGTADRAYFIRLAEMFAGVADALELAHAEGVIHRDIKPSNILLDADGVLKVVDFGLARFDDESLSMTITGDLLGTPIYMSPEQAMAKRIKLDRRTDIYSLGATLYEVLTLRPPFEATSLQELCSQIITKDPVLPRRANRRIPRDLETIVCKAMEKDRDKRYQSAREFARDLRLFAEGGAIRARRIGPVGRTLRRVKRHKVRSSLVAAVVVLALAGGFFWLQAARASARARELEYFMLNARAHEAFIRYRTGGSGLRPLHPVGETPAELFAQAIELMPERPEAYLGRALCDGDLAARLADLDEALLLGLSPRTYHFARGNVYRMAARWRDAKEEERRAAGLGVRSAADAYFEGRILNLRGMWREAVAPLTRAIEMSSRESSFRYLAHHARAGAREVTGDLAGALEDLLALRNAGDKSYMVRVHVASLWRRLKQPDRARRTLNALVGETRRTGTARAWRRLSVACRKSAESAWADVVTRAWVDAAPGSALAHRFRGMVLVDLERHDEALRAYDRSLKLREQSTSAHAGRAWVLIELKRYGEAHAAAERAVEIDPRSAGARTNLGVAFWHLGERDAALEECNRAIGLAPLRAPSHNALGFVLQEAEHHDKAVNAFRRAIEIDPSNASFHYNLGISLHGLQRYADAVEAYDSALVLKSRFFDALHNKGFSLLALDQPERALKAFMLALALSADERGSAETHNRIAGALQDMGESTDALAAYDKAIEADPEYAYAYCNRGWALKLVGRTEEALESLDRAIKLDPEHVHAYYRKGQVEVALGHPEDALKTYSQGIKLDPDYPDLRYRRGELLVTLKKWQPALDDLNHAVELDPDDAAARINRAAALGSLGREEDALEDCKHALRIDPHDWTARVAMADSLRYLGRHDEAVRAYDHALELRPKDARTHYCKGLALNHDKQYAKALNCFNQAVACDSNHLRARHNRALMLHALGRYGEARKGYEAVLEIDENNLFGLNNLAILLADCPEASLRDPDRAIELARKATQLADDFANGWNTLGVALYRAGKWEEAFRALEQSMELLDGGDASDWFFLAMAEHKRGDKRKAREWYDKAVAWKAKNKPDDADLERYRAEAEALLGGS